MYEPIIISNLLSLFWGLLGFAMARYFLGYLDARHHFHFATWLNNANDIGVGIYLAGRILAVCVLLGLLLS